MTTTGAAFITAYDRATGRVMRVERINLGIDPVVIPPEWDWIVGYVDASGQLVDPATGEIVDQPEMPIVVTGNEITGIPVGATLAANGIADPDPITDGDYGFDVDHPQTVYVVIQHPLYLPWHQEISLAPNEN